MSIEQNDSQPIIRNEAKRSLRVINNRIKVGKMTYQEEKSVNINNKI